MAINTQIARTNMIKQQVRTWDVTDEQVVKLLTEIPREHFTPSEYVPFAYADIAIPLPKQRMMMPPKEQAKIVQELRIKPSDKILLVGSGSGYLLALLAKLGKEVFVIDEDVQLAQQAQAKCSTLDITNIQVLEGDISKAWVVHGPFDVIVINGSLAKLPDIFLRELKINGRCFAVLGYSPAMEAVIIQRTDKDNWLTNKLFETVTPRLAGISEPIKFQF